MSKDKIVSVIVDTLSFLLGCLLSTILCNKMTTAKDMPQSIHVEKHGDVPDETDVIAIKSSENVSENVWLNNHTVTEERWSADYMRRYPDFLATVLLSEGVLEDYVELEGDPPNCIKQALERATKMFEEDDELFLQAVELANKAWNYEPD